MSTWSLSQPIDDCSTLTTRCASIILNHVVHHHRDRNIDHVIAAISDPTRRAIIERLAHGPGRISDVAQRFSMSLTGFCKHVKVLERAKLVRRIRHGRENTLELSPGPLRDVARWILKYEQFWNMRLDRLEDRAGDAAAADPRQSAGAVRSG